jgi:two-component system, cell cycle sensor histidine kinase and response regulator CckA
MDLLKLPKEELIKKIIELNERIKETESEIISLNKKSEDLSNEQFFFHTLLDNIPDFIYFKDVDSRFFKINKSQAKYFNLVDPSIAIGKTDFDFFTKEHAEEAFNDEQELIKSGKPYIIKEEKSSFPDGRTIWQSTIKMPLINDSGMIIGTFGISRDITEQKKFNDLLDSNEKLLKIILENALIGFAILNMNGNYHTVNKIYCELTGYSNDEFIGLNIIDLTYHADKEKTSLNLQKIFEKNLKECKSEKRYITKQNQNIIVMSHLWVINDKNDNPVFLVETIDDISERKKAEYEIRMLANAIKSISECISITDMEDNIIFVNEAFLKTYGYEREELIGKNISIVRASKNPSKHTEKILSATLSGGWHGELINRRKNEEEFPIQLSSSIINDDYGNPVALIGISVDITEQKRLQNELQRALKLESIGTLAGGIAHDFNNILVGILGNLSLAKLFVKPEDKIFEKLNDIEIATLKAKDLSNKLVTFAKGGNPRKKISAISQFLKEVVQYSLSGSNSLPDIYIQTDLWDVEYDETQIRQVISNIVFNSIEAMPGGGIVKVRAENLILPPESGYSLTEGPYIKISIADEGIGIPEENLNKIFDPFFSTKFLGRGIGLSTAYSIIKKHNGYINIDSTLGKGTKVFMFLPAFPPKYFQTIDGETTQIIEEKRKYKILVMDDEENVRDFFKEFLTFSGHEIVLAENGEEAIHLFKESKDIDRPYEIVILDLTVPQSIGAKETISELLKIDKDVKAIVASGYSNDEVIFNFRKYGFKAALIKPFGIERLKHLLNKLMSEDK